MIGHNWKDDWGLSLSAPIETRTSSSLSLSGVAPTLIPLTPKESNSHDSVGDSNISRPLSVVYGTRIPDSIRDTTNLINDLKKTDDDDVDEVQDEESTPIAPSHPTLQESVSFEDIYPREEEDEITFTHSTPTSHSIQREGGRHSHLQQQQHHNHSPSNNEKSRRYQTL